MQRQILSRLVSGLLLGTLVAVAGPVVTGAHGEPSISAHVYFERSGNAWGSSAGLSFSAAQGAWLGGSPGSPPEPGFGDSGWVSLWGPEFGHFGELPAGAFSDDPLTGNWIFAHSFEQAFAGTCPVHLTWTRTDTDPLLQGSTSSTAWGTRHAQAGVFAQGAFPARVQGTICGQDVDQQTFQWYRPRVDSLVTNYD